VTVGGVKGFLSLAKMDQLKPGREKQDKIPFLVFRPIAKIHGEDADSSGYFPQEKNTKGQGSRV